ncbi:nuclear protein SNF4 [Pseudohyphozyma bogoriensis]|nr:nuclear protein SNF4 [Pseudohyphozyma bogoriensis]
MSAPTTNPSTPLSSSLPTSSVTPARPNSKKDPHFKALDSIRHFLESKTCYEILPESFRLIVFDNKLPITRSLQALVTNGVVSAPLYDSTTQRFAGMFTLADVVHLIQYYYLTAHEYENVVEEVDRFQLGSLRKIEQAIDVPPPPTIFVHPEQPLADACAALVKTHARRLPLVDRDEQTGKETIVSVLTQYRVLKFIAINCPSDVARLDQSIGSLGIGSYVSWYSYGGISVPPSQSANSAATAAATPPSSTVPLPSTTPSNSESPNTANPSLLSPPQPTRRSRSRSIGQSPAPTSEGINVDKYSPLATATLGTSVFDVVHIFSERGISAVPVLGKEGTDQEGVVVNMYETVDIVDLVRQNAYQVLDKTIEVALQQRSQDFTGVMTCTPNDTLSSILSYIREKRCHRFVIIEPEDLYETTPDGGRILRRRKGALVGILSLSDVLRYLVGHENLKGLEVEGLVVNGLRGVLDPSKDGKKGSPAVVVPKGAETETEAEDEDD